MKNAKQKPAGKTVQIVLRGCVMRVAASAVQELQRLESAQLRKEWNTNQLP